MIFLPASTMTNVNNEERTWNIAGNPMVLLHLVYFTS